jgi:tocopherol cyclase
VFEPHWQVTYADARASGTVIWNGTRYEFTDQPFYAEKNWGKSLPRKWYWTQCNSFNGYNDLSVTAGGGIRKVPFGQEESLGMVSVHYNGTFYEAVPWKGDMEWNVSTWGYWGLRGSCYEGANPFAVEVTYECDPEELPGLVFRAPTPDEGMVYFCRDTFDAKCTLSLWELEVDRSSLSGRRKFIKKEPPIIDRATSRQGGAEIGGGPWWSEWKAKSRLKRVIKTLLSLPNKLGSPAS